jgi:Uma2 family endonuclease
MGEGTLQRFISELLRALIERWFEARGKPVFVGADQFFYWEQRNPAEGIAPDVYVLPGARPGTRVGSWKVWETGLVPSFAFEVVSRDIDKDYLNSPAKYARLGVDELIVFDPDYLQSRSRYRWQVFRRTRRGLVRVVATDADRVRSKVLGCYLRAVGSRDEVRVRLATGPNGQDLFPTAAEAERAERAARETAEAARETAEAARETAEAARETAEAALGAERKRAAELEAELAALQARSKKPLRNGGR